jgi:hypothetical protein
MGDLEGDAHPVNTNTMAEPTMGSKIGIKNRADIFSLLIFIAIALPFTVTYKSITCFSLLVKNNNQGKWMLPAGCQGFLFAN